MQLRKSERKQAKIKLALQGSAGSGKTYSSLLLAKGLTNGDFSKIAIIDTENKSADLYAHLGDYNVVSLDSPFSSEKFIEAIDLCLKAGMEVIIIDSISHCWDYLIEFHSSMPGNSFTNWGKITPMQNKFINKILQSDAHFIATMRTKQDYVLNERNGKYIPEKVGLKAIQRDGVDYEFTIVLDININHQIKASKDRTGLFIDKPEFIINTSTGKKILEWCNQGVSLDDVKKEINATTTLEGLRHLYQKYNSLKQQIHPLIMTRKSEIENTTQMIVDNKQIINPKTIQNNGIDSSNTTSRSSK
jgi:hypothetical protein